MSKVLVDRELLDSAATWLEVHAPGGGCVEGSVAEDLRAILEQPAEAEGVEVVAWQQRYICPDEGPSCWQSADERTLEILRRRDDYELRQLVPLTALSAVTAERDRLQSQLAETQANDRTAMGYLHDVRQLVGGSDFPEMVRNVARMVDALPGCVELIEALSPIEGDVLRKARAAMAAKEA